MVSLLTKARSKNSNKNSYAIRKRLFSIFCSFKKKNEQGLLKKKRMNTKKIRARAKKITFLSFTLHNSLKEH